MSKGKKTGGRNIPSGQSLNPAGMTKHPAVMKAIRYETKEAIAKLYLDCLHLTTAELMAKLGTKETPNMTLTMFERNIISALWKDSAKGQVTTLEKLVERILGKPKEFIDLSGTVKLENALDMSKLTDEDVRTMLDIHKRGRISRGAAEDP